MNKALNAFVASGLVVLGGAAHAQQAGNIRLAFDIQSQGMEAALTEFAQATNLQVLFLSDIVPDQPVPQVSGSLTPEAALQQLLAESGLRYEFINARTVTIRTADLSSTNATVPTATSDTSAERDTMRLAQTEPSDKLSAVNRPSSEEPRDGLMDEVVVTGSHIRGEEPVGSQLIRIDRKEIERSGLPRTEDVIRTLPQVFGGGPSSDSSFSGESGQVVGSNVTKATAPNLRGLGAGYTLLLVDGQRLAPAGRLGLFSSISGIPLSAVETIEVLPDGASALYGSDAVGGVINVILRKNYRGFETQARIGSVTDGEAKDYQVSQTFGTFWSSGRGMLSYEFMNREHLLASERSFMDSSTIVSPTTGLNFDRLENNPGTIRVGTNTYAIPTGQDGTDLEPSDFVRGTSNPRNRADDQWMLPDETRNSLMGSIWQNLGERTTLKGQALFARRKTKFESPNQLSTLTVRPVNPFYVNPTGGTGNIQVLYNFTDDFGPNKQYSDTDSYNGTLSLTTRFGSDWEVSLDTGYAREKASFGSFALNSTALNAALISTNPATAFNPFGDGSFTNPAVLDAIRGRSDVGSDSDVWNGEITANGSLWTLPAGPVKLAIGSQYRKHGLESSTMMSFQTTPNSAFSYERTIRSAFAEIRVPLVSSLNAVRGVEALTLSLAGRYDKYSDYGDSSVPKIGLSWSPIRDFALRGAWSKSFKAPDLFTLDETPNVSLIQPTPNGGVTTPTLLWLGSNRDLQPETATTLNFGFDVTPRAVPGLKASVSYFDIQFEGQIQGTLSGLGAAADLSNPLLRDFIITNPTPEQRELVCSRSVYAGPAADCLNLTVGAIFDQRLQNIAKVRNRGIDLTSSYDLETSVGAFSFDLNASYVLALESAIRADSPFTDTLNFIYRPVDLRGRAALSWSRKGFTAGTYINYTDSYQFTAALPLPISSWTTTDVFLSYQSPALQGLLSGTTLGINVQNAFDKNPPAVPDYPAYDASNADALGRVVSFQVRKSW